MKPLPHTYEVRVGATSTDHVTLSSGGVPALRSAPPVDFDGPGDAWSPEQLLLGAVATCFCFTFRAVARAMRVPFTSLDVTVEGIVDRADGRMRFTEMVVRPRLTVPPGTDSERARRALVKGEETCLVSASLASSIRLEPDLIEATS